MKALKNRHTDHKDGVMVEIKAKYALEEVDFVQALSYLKASGYKVGLLLNFGGEEAGNPKAGELKGIGITEKMRRVRALTSANKTTPYCTLCLLGGGIPFGGFGGKEAPGTAL